MPWADSGPSSFSTRALLFFSRFAFSCILRASFTWPSSEVRWAFFGDLPQWFLSPEISSKCSGTFAGSSEWDRSRSLDASLTGRNSTTGRSFGDGHYWDHRLRDVVFLLLW